MSKRDIMMNASLQRRASLEDEISQPGKYDPGCSPRAAHGMVPLRRSPLSPLRALLRQDRGLVTSAQPVHLCGIDQVSNIMLILIGVTPMIILDTFSLTKACPTCRS
jgi:hypothetical protein